MSLRKVPIGSSSSEGSKPGIAVSPAVLRIAAAVPHPGLLLGGYSGELLLDISGIPAAGNVRRPQGLSSVVVQVILVGRVAVWVSVRRCRG
ncbi:hypothetical protein R1flu_017699 [Riccia fluitans]|uniref:Uncharacterized protein n=1 Tax=Riccia fluitans TaxID=41844 RepID=A0ABD1ZF16_9MARC